MLRIYLHAGREKGINLDLNMSQPKLSHAMFGNIPSPNKQAK